MNIRNSIIGAAVVATFTAGASAAFLADEGVPQNLMASFQQDEGIPWSFIALKADEGVPHNLVALQADEGVPQNLVALEVCRRTWSPESPTVAASDAHEPLQSRPGDVVQVRTRGPALCRLLLHCQEFRACLVNKESALIATAHVIGQDGRFRLHAPKEWSTKSPIPEWASASECAGHPGVRTALPQCALPS